MIALGIMEGALLIQCAQTYFYEPAKLMRLAHPRASELFARLLIAAPDERRRLLDELKKNFELTEIAPEELAKAREFLIEID